MHKVLTSINEENLTFKSGGEVELLLVFEVELGAELTISMEDCVSKEGSVINK
jgi:hypothetical protein